MAWTEKEVEILKKTYGTIPSTEIHERFLLNRNPGAIRSKARRMQLRSALDGKITNPPPQYKFESTSVNPNAVSNLKDNALLEELGRRGYISIKQQLPKTDETYELDSPLEPFEVGVVSCTHLCSKYQQITFLNRFYRICEKRGIQVMVNAGDMVEGNGKLYRGQVYDIFVHGADAQVNYAEKNYPRIDGMVTYIVGGNHEDSFYKTDGTNVNLRIAEKRDDILYLGTYGAYLTIGDIKIYIMHGSGGVAYARSYRLQKIIEQMAPQLKPHILLAGHWHVANHLPMYRNVEGFQLGCFQAQTPYMKRKGIYPTLAGLIIKIYPDEDGLQGVDTHWRYYYEPIEHDY